MTADELHARLGDGEGFTILGQRLDVLRIGHVDMLHRFGCQFPANPGDLAMAVLICAMRPSSVLPWFRSRWLAVRLAWLNRRLGAWDFREKLAMWNEYWDRNTRLPTFSFRRPAAIRKSGVPFHQFLRSVLLSRLNYRPSEIEDVPYLQALWDIAGLLEYEGRAEVLQSDIDSDPDLSAEEEAELILQAEAVLNSNQ